MKLRNKREEGEQPRDSNYSPGAAPESCPPQGIGSASRSWLVGADLGQARKRILWGGGAGLAAAAINLIVIMSTYFGDAGVEGVIQPSSGQFILVMVEVVVVVALAAAVLRRSRAGAITLLAYHLVSKLALFGLAALGLGPGNLHPVSLVLNLVFAYLYFQGWRGTLTWHHLTHPGYPAIAPGCQFHEVQEEKPR